MHIIGTQFLLPDGRKREFTTDIPDGLADQWKTITDLGVGLKAEMLTTGEVDLALVWQGDNFDIETISNGQEAPKALEAMIARFDVRAYEKWKKEIIAPRPRG